MPQLEPTAPPPRIRWAWLRLLLFTVAMFVAMAIAGVAGVHLVLAGMGLSPDTPVFAAVIFEPRNAGWLILMQGITTGAAVVVVVAFRRLVDRQTVTSLGFSLEGKLVDTAVGAAIGVLLMAAGTGILVATGTVTVDAMAAHLPTMVAYLVLFFIAALNEELIFRGYVLTNLMGSCNKYLALLLSAIPFAIIHFTPSSVQLVPALNLLLAGLFLGVYVMHRRNLWFPIAMHVTWNFFQGPVFGFNVSGYDLSGVFKTTIAGHPLLTGGDFGFEGSVVCTGLLVVSTIALHLIYRPSTPPHTPAT